MRFDTVIIGGGLSGLISGIECARAGQKAAIVSAGQSALHFWSGSFELLGQVEEETVIDRPLSFLDKLSEKHPYRVIGEKRLRSLLGRVPSILTEAGLKATGSLERNHLRLTPLGFLKPAWLTLDDYVSFEAGKDLPWKKVALVNIYSYIDFYPRFLAYGLEKRGVECSIAAVNIPELDTLRKSTTEMRATNMSRFLTDAAVDHLAAEVNKVARGVDAVIMPAVLGIFSDAPVERLRKGVDVPVWFVPTTPASVPGVRCQLSLRDLFIRLGGEFLPGDTVRKGEFDKNRLRKVYTVNLGDMPLDADNFIISTGSFFGHGLIADIEKIYEPVFGLDLNVSGGRTEWYEKDFYASQPYMTYGVITDNELKPSRKGETIENLYATGALLAGFNALKEGSGAGITLSTALHAASRIVG
ncbi:MAG: glycerol-3-phosphate dehydrogenase subunit GlpB [Muribaculaceae bacterium]|nr:glycerol-3-phosphate dehydrogenase subunit GlpB [Muribaculaceae bacterium]MDE6754038.1 glycerol-3-phosphate dehydrogenase subunit GlpB [Muribaculaceae bacterium]